MKKNYQHNVAPAFLAAMRAAFRHSRAFFPRAGVMPVQWNQFAPSKTLCQSSSSLVSSVTEENAELNEEGYYELMRQLKEKFSFKAVAITLRESYSASSNGWSAVMLDENDCCIPLEPNSCNILKFFIFCNLADRKMAMVVYNRLVLCIIEVEFFSSFVWKKEIFLDKNIFHFRILII